MAKRLKINSKPEKRRSARVTERNLKRNIVTISANNHRNGLSCLMFTESAIKILEPGNRTFTYPHNHISTFETGLGSR
jgi:hypothetical protein